MSAKTTRPSLARFAWLSVGAAIATIVLKLFAWWLTDSVGLLSDALESFVNLAAALVTLGMLILATRPPTEQHAYGFSKAEYLASAFEGLLILLAACGIAYAAIQRFMNPLPIQQAVAGVTVSLLASIINFAVARVLLRQARDHRSIALDADARHLMTDVWTSIGVVFAVGAVAVTGWWRLDPIIALAVAANIVWTGGSLLLQSFRGLMDEAIPGTQREAVITVLDSYYDAGVRYHALRTRRAAGRSFISVHVLVPGEWTVTDAHHIVEEIEARIRVAVPGSYTETHLEPVGDPSSYEDIDLDR
ncbi:MAG TPA: cation diffusion facilitator family transporter [Burkholderiales bacterium]